MADRRLFLGIDTSNYKTSLAVIDDSASIVFEKSELLEVKPVSLSTHIIAEVDVFLSPGDDMLKWLYAPEASYLTDEIIFEYGI